MAYTKLYQYGACHKIVQFMRQYNYSDTAWIRAQFDNDRKHFATYKLLVLSLASANEHRISPTLADRVSTYVDFINSPQNKTI